MHPFLSQYLPTGVARNKENQDMLKEKEEGFRLGEKWTSKYLFHTPLERVYRKIAEKEEIEEEMEELGVGQEQMSEPSDIE